MPKIVISQFSWTQKRAKRVVVEFQVGKFMGVFRKGAFKDYTTRQTCSHTTSFSTTYCHCRILSLQYLFFFFAVYLSSLRYQHHFLALFSVIPSFRLDQFAFNVRILKHFIALSMNNWHSISVVSGKKRKIRQILFYSILTGDLRNFVRR